MQYKYTGQVKVSINGVGLVLPGATFESDIVINHPDFKVKEPDKHIKETKVKGAKV